VALRDNIEFVSQLYPTTSSSRGKGKFVGLNTEELSLLLTPTIRAVNFPVVKYTEPYHSAVELQRLMMGDARKEDLKPLVRAGIARAFVELEMLKLRLRMKPAPKPIDVTSLQTKKVKPHTAELLEMPQPGSSQAKA
jgi:hypothetical protein